MAHGCGFLLPFYFIPALLDFPPLQLLGGDGDLLAEHLLCVNLVQLFNRCQVVDAKTDLRRTDEGAASRMSDRPNIDSFQMHHVFFQT